MLIDTHAHINFNAFKDDGDEVIRRSLDGNVWMILVGSEYKTSKRALDYANRYEKGVYAAIGLHPIHAADVSENGKVTPAEEFNIDLYEKMTSADKVVAIGEIGLDYYHLDKDSDVEAAKKKQKQIFLSQLELAAKSGLPVIIHCREAHDDMLLMLKEFKKEYKNILAKNRPWGVMHCFSGDESLAWEYFSLGLIISFTGLITFSKQWDELIRRLPLDKFMVETDCPYMTPSPHRGKRNEPLYLEYVVNRIAEIKNLSPKKIAEITTRTAKEMFRL